MLKIRGGDPVISFEDVVLASYSWSVEGMNVEELIEQLQKVKNKNRIVLSYDSSTPVELNDDGVDENPIYL